MSCIICEDSKSTIFYSFDSTTTMHTETPLKEFCQKIFGVPFPALQNSDELICECCFNAFTELDHMEMRTKELTSELRKKYHRKKNKTKESRILIKAELYSDSSTNETLDENELNDNKLEDRSQSVNIKIEQSDHKLSSIAIGKIHFSNENDLRNILDVQLFNKKSENNHWEEEGSLDDGKIGVLYDMMDERTIEMCVQEKVNNIPKKIFKCKACLEVFNTREELKSHGETHTDKPFICEICGKGYRHKTALDIHVGMHNGINPFKCLYCNKTFTQKGALIRHVKIHTGEKPFQCEECGKCFTHHTSFNVHKISHSGQKSYKCEVCGLGLISTSHLKRHMRVHTGEKRFSCPICGKRFAERYNLVSHSKLHTNGALSHKKKKFRCDGCGLTYSNRIELNEHLLKVHSSTDMFIALN